jgi:hypothetical protein
MVDAVLLLAISYALLCVDVMRAPHDKRFRPIDRSLEPHDLKRNRPLLLPAILAVVRKNTTSPPPPTPSTAEA